MESLERKLERLSPEQRREVEDFLDFLLQRKKTSPPPPLHPGSAPPVLQEPAPVPEPINVFDLIRRQGPPIPPQEDPVALLMQEIVADGDDSLTEDSMDYGQFEEGKKKIAGKKQDPQNDPAEGRAADLLEWID
jgi:hypothetical protein